MSLAIGTRVGAYEIVAALGAGGMGEVYRARDVRLGRDVAIKTLSAAFTNDADRLARFEREARALAALNHPNIATIHGVEESDPSGSGRATVTALVMELVEGDTLADRLRGGALTLDKAVPIARQLADALEAAHDKGIVHRDLKPANIKITPSGHVKVLDFGLAKLVVDDVASSAMDPSMTLASREGLVVGTAAYMSPEQARGQAVDTRTDIWAFGCVLYEMLTGSSAFQGSGPSELIAEVLKADPDWSRLPASTPPDVRRLLDRCLRKDRSRRLKDIADARLELEEVTTPTEAPSRARLGRGERAAWAAAVVALIAAVAVVSLLRRPPPVPERRFEINIGSDAPFAISPDGTTVAYSAVSGGQSRLWLRPLDSLNTQELAGTEGARLPFWSPDGRAIGFYTDLQIKRVSLDDGSVRTIADAVPVPGGASWSRENVILYSGSGGAPIWQIHSDGGKPIAATRFEANQRGHIGPQFLPDGRHFLFYITGSPDTRGVHLGQLGDVSSHRLADADGPAVFAQTSGHLLFMRAGKLLAQPFDLDRLQLSGEPLVIDDHIASGLFLFSWAVISSSAAGPFVYRKAAADAGQRQLVWVDRKGQELRKVVYPDTMPMGPALSHDGRRVALFRLTNGNTDVWSYAVERRTWDRLTVHAGDDIYPLWSRDDTEIVFSSRRGSMDLFRKRLDAPLENDELLLSTPQPKFPTDWSIDGRFVLYNTLNPRGNIDIWALPLDGSRTPFEVVGSEFNEQHAQFSPDGRWITYQSDRTGRFEIYVRPFPGPGPDVAVSASGGGQPRWNPKGSELFYIAADDRLMAVPIRVAGGAAVEPGEPRALFLTTVGTTAPNTNRHQFMVAPDGESFVMNSLPSSVGPTPLVVVVNWKPRS